MATTIDDAWPPLPFGAWRDTCATVHRLTQLMGKIRLALTPLVNHYWNAALHLTARGLTTRPTPYRAGWFEMELDFVDHDLKVRSDDGAVRALALEARPLADSYRELLAMLEAMRVHVAIDDRPVEVRREVIPFAVDRLHGAYDPAWAARFFRALASSAFVLEEFRAGFLGKCSPVHFFWGSFDLACSRFSGRRAPVAPGTDRVTREAYSHEVASAGFWPGDDRFPEPAFYAYAAPAPLGYASATVAPAGAFWHDGLQNFLLPYELVRRSGDPRAALLAFFQSSYDAAAELGGWDRAALERPRPPAPSPPPPAVEAPAAPAP